MHNIPYPGGHQSSQDAGIVITISELKAKEEGTNFTKIT